MDLIESIKQSTSLQRAQVWNIVGVNASKNHIILALQTALNDADEELYYEE